MFLFLPLKNSPRVTHPKAEGVLWVPSPGRVAAKVTWPELWSTAPSQAEQMVPSAHILSDWYCSEGEILAAKHTNCQLQIYGRTDTHILPPFWLFCLCGSSRFSPTCIFVFVVLCFFSLIVLFFWDTNIYKNT